MFTYIRWHIYILPIFLTCCLFTNKYHTVTILISQGNQINKKVPIKSPLSICLSVHLSVQHFSPEWLIGFSSAQYLTTDRGLFSKKIHFCPNLGKKGPKWSQNRFFCIFWKILSLVFPGINLKWKLILLYWYFTTNLIFGKIPFLKLWATMLSGNQVAGFIKM